ncbi:MAG TPA: hypothetical protein DEF39_09930 [Hungateiclostridium thermocellum]|jgi:Mrp family chromosome partitioning ATPase|uniref:AAA domain-containing protein n=2 Tax=Acetivibrio thermocellus TaxID=1515 RepID=A3DD32_ACET2|nr:hypothetical protein [Acetivibrio thermocellus]CDG35317.1 hypothetical protein CTHBC1_0653 [Acetivibrio thermocellus BC1]ABN51861.1 hypothetical protein Cthe_0626 [Acetivibrio thermocellus ATCC 27405]ADU74663.1 hypothetical protein Clo1313_1602 [Acetivibrio thermocellus DSM 1313]ALX08606.1 AAA domain containing protein [Acetivibrio thermocellus AD2]ANV76355.1 AAA domain containing protein [Acetivibrio thermocellus DSM 2360]
MKLYLVAGSKSDMLKRSLEENQDIEVVYIANSFEEALNHLIRNSLDFDSMLLMDAGIVENTESFTDTLNTLRELMNSSYPNITIKFITKDPVYLNNYNNIVSGDDRFEVYFVDNVRIPISYIQEVCLKNQNKKSSRIQPVEKQVADDSSKTSDEKLTQTLTAKSKTIFGVRLPFFSKSNASEEKLENGETNNSIIGSYVQPKQKISLVSKDFRKVIVVTGCRGAGATSTAANLAIESSAQGLSTILVDMDIQYRGVNLYFPKFGDEVEYNPDLSYSLVRCVIKPDSYDINSCRINDNLFVTTLAYSISSKDKLLEIIDLKKLSAFINFLRLKFNVVLIDMPISTLSKYSQLLTQIDSIALCVNNNLYSVISTVRTVEDLFVKEDLVLFTVKSRPVLTKYNEANRHNGKTFTPELACKIICELGGYNSDLTPAGIVPYSREFDLQIDSGQKITSTNKVYKNHYFTILKNLL